MKKMKPAEILYEWGEGKYRRMPEGVNSTMIYCKKLL
jgi:hypothetical protein